MSGKGQENICQFQLEHELLVVFKSYLGEISLLPCEIWLIILSYCSTFEIYLFPFVSKNWYFIAQEDNHFLKYKKKTKK